MFNNFTKKYTVILRKSSLHMYIVVFNSDKLPIYTLATKDVFKKDSYSSFSDESFFALFQKLKVFLDSKSIKESECCWRIDGRYQKGGKFCRALNTKKAVFNVNL